VLGLRYVSKIYIAFIECTFHDNPPFWIQSGELDDPEESSSLSDTRELYIAQDNGARLSLVDLGGTRRYYSFIKHGVVEIMGNVATIIDRYAEELAIDESKQFPKKKRMDE